MCGNDDVLGLGTARHVLKLANQPTLGLAVAEGVALLRTHR